MKPKMARRVRCIGAYIACGVLMTCGVSIGGRFLPGTEVANSHSIAQAVDVCRCVEHDEAILAYINNLSWFRGITYDCVMIWPRDFDEGRNPVMYCVTSGWPCRSLAGRVESLFAPGGRAIARVQNRWCVGIPVPQRVGPARSVVVPIRPMVVGFALDVMFYGAVVYGAASCWRAAICRRRRRRSCCIRCGYDLRLLSSRRCPECGWIDEVSHEQCYGRLSE